MRYDNGEIITCPACRYEPATFRSDGQDELCNDCFWMRDAMFEDVAELVASYKRHIARMDAAYMYLTGVPGQMQDRRRATGGAA